MVSLRWFVLCFIITFFTEPLFSQSTMVDSSKKKTLYVIGYSHLDTQWRWDYQTTIREYVKNTMVDNFKLFEKYPDYILNFSGANRYRMMKEYYPEQFERVKKYIIEGRWFPCGSSMEECDVLVPSPESIIRQILYGNLFFMKEFGKSSDEFMLPDCFGFPSSLPTILSHCGIRGFSTQKLTWGSAIGIPFNIGRWIGNDGSSVIASFNPGDYVGQIREDLSSSSKWLTRIEELGKLSGVYSEYMYYGTGDVGGAPSEESVIWLEKSINGKGPIRVISSPANILFDNISEEQADKFPIYKGELLLTNHSAGSLTSQAYMKRWNRKNESLAMAAEISAVVGKWLGGFTYPEEKLREAWRLVLGAQFHDILPGTCIPRAYEYSWNDEVLAMNQFGGVLSDAMGTIALAMDTRTIGIPLLLFNPLSIEREEIVEANVKFHESLPEYLCVLGPDGKEVLSQEISRDEKSITLLFLAKVPPTGFSVYEVQPSISPCMTQTGLSVKENFIENNFFKVVIDQNGDPKSIYDKINKREVISEPVRLAFQHEKPTQWPAWNMDWEDRKLPPSGFVDGPAKIRITESGPVRVSLEIEREAKGSMFVQRISLTSNGKRIDFNNYIDWFTHESSLKATFPLTVSNPLATYNTGAGTIERGNNDPKKFEVPSQQWFDLTDKDGNYGVSVIEDSKYGSDKPEDNVLRLTLLYTPGVRRGYKDQATQDFGKHEIFYSLYPHAGDWRKANSESEGLKVNNPIRIFQTAPHDGFLGKYFSFLRINNPAVSLIAMKKSELNDKLILRFFEMKGEKQSNVEVFLPDIPKSVQEVDGQEKIYSEVKHGKLKFDINPFQIKSFSIELPSPAKKVEEPVSFPLKINYDICAFTSESEKQKGNFDEKGRSYPAELLPQTLKSGGVEFSLGSTEQNSLNAASCKGQVIRLPEGKFNRIFLLAASSDKDTEATFYIDGKPVTLTIAEWSGFIGQWDNRIWVGYKPRAQDFVWDSIFYRGLTPGYIKNHNVALFTTHLHKSDNENEPYVYGYIFSYYINIPGRAKEIRLPQNSKVKIFAMTLVKDRTADTFSAFPLFDLMDRKNEDYKNFQLTSTPVISADTYIIEEDSIIEVRITTDDPGSDVHYTLDGSDPTPLSARYLQPLKISDNTFLKAIAFHPEKQPSYIDSAKFYRAYHIENIVYNTQPSEKYIGRGQTTLINSVRATSSFGDKEWQGFEAIDADVVLDLGRLRKVSKVTVGCLSDNTSWIFLPSRIEVRTSKDGVEYSPGKARVYEPPLANEGVFIRDLIVDFETIEAQFIHIRIKNIGTCPSWHPGAGGKAWLFIDEIFVE
mgnify:CR=1 FL=1